MIKETQQLLTSSTIYSIGNILVKLVSFVLIPLYARKLLPEEYGVVAILELIELLGKTIFVFGLSNSVLRFLVHYQQKHREDQLIFSIYLFLLFCNIFILGIIYWYPYPLVYHFLTSTPENVLYFRYTLIAIFAGVFQIIFITILQAEEKPFQFVGFTFITFLLLIFLNLYKVGILNQGILGIMESKLYVALFELIVVNVYILKRIKPHFSTSLLKESLNYGIPLIFVGISLTLLTLADRYFLKIYRDMGEVGVYTMAYKFGMIINMVLITPFRQAFYPLMFRLAEHENIRTLYRRYLTYFLFVGMLLFLIIALFSREILILATSPKYVSGYVIVPVILFSYLLFGIRLIFANVLASRQQTRVIAYTTMTGAVLNVGLNMILIPSWGIWGAAIATLLSYSFITLTTYIFQQRVYEINWDWHRNRKVAAIAMILLLTGVILHPNTLFVALLWKVILILAYPLILYFTGFFTPQEREGILLAFKKFGKW